MITRSVEMVIQGYIVSGGYTGKTNELDNLVQQAAELMQKTFNRNVEIRFNSDHESGGAWLKDNEGSRKIGIGIMLGKSKFRAMTTKEKVEVISKDYDKLPYDMLVITTLIDDGFLSNKVENNHTPFIYRKERNTLQEGIEGIFTATDKSILSQYLENII